MMAQQKQLTQTANLIFGCVVKIGGAKQWD